MGKIRTKSLGTEEEPDQKKKDKARREGKKAQKKAHAPGMEGGGRLVDMSEGPIIEEPYPIGEKETEGKATKKVKKEVKPKKISGHKYSQVKVLVDRTKKYPLEEAITLVKKTSFTKFDGTVEVHINTDEKGLRGNVALPHGTGRQVKVAIANEDLIKEVENGKINFDILITTPDLMPKLAKVAKILGPKGLMPNPKSGTISTDTEKLKEKLSKGQIQYKTEAEAPIIHSVIGKVSFENLKLIENLKALVKAIDPKHILSLFLNCTMGPGIKVDLEKI